MCFFGVSGGVITDAIPAHKNLRNEIPDFGWRAAAAGLKPLAAARPF